MHVMGLLCPIVGMSNSCWIQQVWDLIGYDGQ